MAESVLLIDDDPAVLRMLSRLFDRAAWEVSVASTGEEGLARYDAEEPDLVLLDLHLPGMSGMDVLDRLAERGALVILLTGSADVETAVEAMRRGAENFLSKPVRPEHLHALAEKAVEKAKLQRVNEFWASRRTREQGEGSLGRSAKMQALDRQIELVAASDAATVLLLGASGTGKGWVAQKIHARSARSSGPFVEVNCAGLSSTFLDSELFGHEQGAFTDAKSLKRGLFEVANGGTLFLDEVGELATELQPKLLKVLEGKRFRRVGGTREISVDVRLIAATNRDLEQEIERGSFRRDLYYRLNVLPIELPPLRERDRDDLVGLIQSLLEQLTPRHPRSPARISARALEMLLGYSWPGNVRELSNVLERALVLGAGAEELRPEHLPSDLRSVAPSAGAAGPVRTLQEVERDHIEQALALMDGNRTRAAKALGISRTTLHAKIKQFGLEG